MLETTTDSREETTYNRRLYDFSLILLSVVNATQSQAEKDRRRSQTTAGGVQSARHVTSSQRSIRVLQSLGSDASFHQYYYNGGGGGSNDDQCTQNHSEQTSLLQGVHPSGPPNITDELVFPDLVDDDGPFTLLAPADLEVVPTATSDNDGCSTGELAAFMGRLERGTPFDGTDLLSCMDESR